MIAGTMPEYRDNLCLLFVCLLFVSVYSDFGGIGLHDIVYIKCRANCDNNLDAAGEEYYCDGRCRVNECRTGCQLYNEAMTSLTCQDVCTDLLYQNITELEQVSSATQIRKLSCIQGCTFGLNDYFDVNFHMTDPGQKLSPPKLVLDSKTHNSVELYWDGASEDYVSIGNVTYFLQQKMADLDTDWQIHNDTVQLPSGNFLINNLHPYVTYQFKLIFKVTSVHTLETEASSPITTLSSGVPSSVPVIQSINAPSPTVVSVSWTPPVFSNGPLLSYRLTLRPLGDTELKPVSNDVSADLTSWMFGHLHSGQQYDLSVLAVNDQGEGPATSRTITTPNAGNLSDGETPYLVLGAANMVVKQRLLELTREAEQVLTKPRSILVTGAKILYQSNSSSDIIQGVGVHVSKQQIVVSDDSGEVTLISLSGDNQEDDIYPELYRPAAIDIDWLHDHAYVIDGQRIYQCTIKSSGNRCIIALDISPNRPQEVKVDPINGYIYFTVYDTMRGLHRLDIADISSSRTTTAQKLLDMELQTFNIDYDNFLLYFPDNSKNTIMSAALDGSGVADMRQNLVARPFFLNIKSMVYYDEKFFWTNGSKVFSEEYDAGNRTYYHNSLLLFERHFRGFNMYYPEAQKVPAPINPPSRVQALFTAYKVMIQWEKPAPLQFQGKGAFSNWDYEIQILQDDGSQNSLHQTEKKLKFEVSNLEPDTQYRVKVRAKSSAGMGPWSKVFIGRTLKDSLDSAKLIIAVPYQFATWQIQEVDMDGQVSRTITQTSQIYRGVSDLTWYKDKTFWITNDGDLFMHQNRADTELQKLIYVQYAASVAFDWLGERLYWSVKKNGMIKRSDLTGSTIEFVYQSLARDMSVDSIEGRLYWVTMTSVESTLLNGNDHVLYYSIPYFSGRYVISLSIDQELQKIFWYVKGFENQVLYSAHLVRYHDNNDVVNTVQLVGDFDDIAKFSVLKYFSHRLLWLDQQSRVTVGNLECNYTSSVTDLPMEVTDFTIKHPSLQPFPAGLSETTVKVIPDMIPSSSITCEGVWQHFNVTWQPSTEVNHGKVAYELSIRGDNMMDILLVTEVNWQDLSGLPPFSTITVSVRGYTHWGSGPLATATIRTPMSVPTRPQAPRVYVTQRKNAATSKLTLAADFRWRTPETINGILIHQQVYYWMSSKPHRRSSTVLPASSRHYILDGLQGNTTYFFQVESCTSAGCNKSEVANATADSVKPVPKLLIAKQNSIVIAEADNIVNTTDTMVTTSAVVMSFLAQDNRNFWISQDRCLEEYHKASASKLLQLVGGVQDMSLDWISRTLYILETNMTTTNIVTYQLDQARHVTLLQRSGTVGNIVIDPYTSTLLWSEQSSPDSGWTMVSSNVDGSNMTTLFAVSESGRSRRAVDTTCNCLSDQQVSSALAMDLSRDGKTEVIYVVQTSVSLMAADVYGCRCRILLATTPADRKGLPPDYLTVDHVHVYWYNKQEQQLYALDKGTSKLEVTPISDVNNILAFGSHLQPLPGSECLDTGSYNGSLHVTHYGNTSVSLTLDEMEWPESCAHISHPAIRYTVYYTKKNDMTIDCSPDGQGCWKKSSYQRQITLDGLEPFTQYTLHAAVSNYYTEYSAAALSDPFTVRTKAGIPSAVGNITAKPTSPNKIKISWPPPSHPNGPQNKILYFIRSSAVMDDGVLKTTTSDAYTYDTIDNITGEFSASIDGLVADHTYSIQVLCTSNQTEGNYITESLPVQVHTYQEPDDLELLEATNTSIQLSWLSPCDGSASRVFIYYAQLTGSSIPIYQSKMDDLPIPTRNCTFYNNTFEGLRPNTDYAFQLKIIYINAYEIYHWPQDEKDLKYVVRTQTGIPGHPEPPVVEEFKTGEFEVTWVPPIDHGEPITQYILQYRQIDKENWSLAHNTSDTRWVVDDHVLSRGYTYVFRIMAENRNGWGPLSINSSLFSYPTLEAKSHDGMITVVAVVGGFLFVCLFVAVIAICLFYRRRRDGKTKKRQFIQVPHGPDQELATLRELPMTAIQQNNTLYAINLVPTDDEIAALPHFRRNQLVLCKFLGSGAFGEVFEGVAKNIISDSSGDTKVAVKTLRKSASDQEKEEFLKEALLMSNFHHAHILSLLGVCLDNDPQFIILELMEGGDLLSFMRACRLSSIQNRAELSLTDLVKICVHVARGCKYLEDMHFVHRDLAARNCLVSSCNPSEMMVKIGDFGLARDIYKNDYYRKEGEGLLPVRWMSPESLVDGVFTTQSDIWAFGILMWEVVTFGQQPYPARTNIEVLHYVRSGGRLDRPDNCPDDFYQLMCKCWKYAPEDRPSFAYLLQQLEQFQETCASISEYLVPIRSSNTPIAAVDGYMTRRRGRMMSTSSDGAEYYGVQRSQYGSQRLYGKIRRATSFDSPEPKDATPQIQTDASNYLEPKLRGMPEYLKVLSDAQTENYMYNTKGERIRNKDGVTSPDSAEQPREPSYVQTTVRENFNHNDPYMKYIQQNGIYGNSHLDNEQYMKYIQQKGIPKSVSKETINSVLQSQTYNEMRGRETIDEDSILHDSMMKDSTNQIVSKDSIAKGPQYCVRKQRLDSSNSCVSFDSVQTEPAYHYAEFNQRNKLYSSSSSKSNHSLSNVPPSPETQSPDAQKGQTFWTNHNNSAAAYAKCHGNNDVKSHMDYLRRGQVYPENAGVLAGYDIVQASLV